MIEGEGANTRTRGQRLPHVHLLFIIAGMSFDDPKPLQPGQILARGVARHLATLGFACVEELAPTRGLRVDVMGLGPKGDVWIIECKSSRADFMSDTKWTGYLEWSDRYFWAVDADFDVDLLPQGSGLIVADGYGAEILRMGDETRLAPARRKVLTHKFAMLAARRLHLLKDPHAVQILG